MTTIAGASQYLNAVTVSNKKGYTAQPTTMMNSTSISLLDVARSSPGTPQIGLSSRARAMNAQFMAATKTGFNAIFGMSTIKMSSIENMTKEINAIRARTPQSQLAESVRGTQFNEQV